MMLLFFLLQTAFAAGTNPLVSGNGFGFAVLGQKSGALEKFYVHPYKFSAPNPDEPFGAGIETHNLIQKVRWDGAAGGDLSYLKQSQIMVHKTAEAQEYYFMPFDLKLPAVIALGQGDMHVTWSHSVMVVQAFELGNRMIEWTRFSDISESALKVPLKGGWAIIALEAGANPKDAAQHLIHWQHYLDGDALVRRELNRIEKWRVKPPEKLNSEQLELWRQSEIILRMAQSREPNKTGRYNHGMIVASLPDGGWFMPWVRDMAYATVALIRMGHQTEARWAVEAYFNARPIGRVKNMVRDFPYQVSVVRYFGDGSEETDFGGENAPNVELDNWGNVLNVLSEYVEKYHDYKFLETPSVRGSVYKSARDFIVKPLLGNMDPHGDGIITTADTSIWEANSGSEQHFSYSAAVALSGLRGFARLAHHMKDEASAHLAEKSVTQLQSGFNSAFIQDGYIHGTLEDNPVYNVDTAAFEAVNFGAVTDPAVISKTLETMEQMKMPSGGYRRIRGDRQYDRQEFVFCDYNWARNWIRLGQAAKGDRLMASVMSKSLADNGFIPEMYVSEINDEYPGALGAPTGSVPMVGFGASMYLIYMLERHQNTVQDF